MKARMIDGANVWQMFRYITLPLITPFMFIAAMIRMIDAVKSFDIIFAITQGGPGIGVGDDQSLSLQRRLHLLRPRLRLGHRGGVLRADRRAGGHACCICASACTWTEIGGGA